MPKFKVTIDKEACIGCGSCEAVCPSNFSMEKGKASVKNKTVDKLECSQTASESCPTDAIKIEKID